MADYSIATTKIGTGTTANLTDDNAIHLYEYFHFPKGTSIGLDLDLFHRDDSDINISIFHGTVTTNPTASIGFGLAGPNWATAMDINGEIDGNDLTLNIENDEFTAGMELGASIDFRFNLVVKYKRESFHFDWLDSHWSYDWHSLVDVDKTLSFDLLSTMINLGETLLTKGAKLVPGLQDIMDCIPDLDVPTPYATNSGITDYVKSDSLFDDWMDFTVTLQAQLDLIQAIETAGKATVETAQPELAPAVAVETEVERGLMKTLEPQIAMGPVFAVSLITYLRVSDIKAYTGTESSSTSVSTSSLSGGDGQLQASFDELSFEPARIGIVFDHRPAIDFGVGWFVKVTWLKVISLSATDVVSAGSLFGNWATIPAGQAYSYEISNEVGTQSISGIEISQTDDWLFA